MRPFGKARADKGIKLNKSFGGSLSLGVLLSYKLQESYKRRSHIYSKKYYPRNLGSR